MNPVVNELRHALRSLGRSPGFAVAAILTLAVGLGANIAIFSLINGLLLRPLPYPDADRLVSVVQTHPRGGTRSSSIPKFVFWRDHAKSFASMAAYDNIGSGLNLSTGGSPERVTVSRVSGRFFDTFATPAALGRGFAEGDDRPNAPRVAVLSHGLWQRRFDSNPNVVGTTLTLDAQPYTVIGVAPAGFRFPATADMWTPLEIDAASTDRTGYLHVVARLEPGTPIETASADMDVVWRQHLAVDDENGLNKGPVRLIPLQTALFGNLRPALLILLAAVGMVLLIAGVNTANLQLARAAARRQEVAVRAALGASPWQVMRPMLWESLLLSLLGGTAGLLLAQWTLGPLLAISPAGISPVTVLHLDARVFGFAFFLAVLVGVLAALPLAWRLRRRGLHEELKQASGRVAAGVGRTRTGKLLVVAEVALAVMLLVAAGLLVRGFDALRTADPGFDSHNVLTMQMSLPPARYGDIEAMDRFTRNVLERVQALPGVTGAAFAVSLPLQGGADIGFTIEGKYAGGMTGAGVGVAQNRPVTADFFESLGIRLRRGRLFTEREGRGAQLVAVVNETAARRYWPGEDPVGQHITLGLPHAPMFADQTTREIIGVVADVREHGLTEEPPAIVYAPVGQIAPPLAAALVRLLPVSLVVKSAVEDPGLVAAVERSIWAVDPEQAVANVRSMDQIVLASLGSERFNALLLGVLSGMALLLSAVGITGVLASLVRGRWREFALRMALGAARGDILRLVITYGVRLAAAGALVGLGGGVLLGRVLASQLNAVQSLDLLVFALSPVALLAVALIASAVPALMATRSDPIAVLRQE